MHICGRKSTLPVTAGSTLNRRKAFRPLHVQLPAPTDQLVASAGCLVAPKRARLPVTVKVWLICLVVGRDIHTTFTDALRIYPYAGPGGARAGCDFGTPGGYLCP